jgi:ketosteroid isomerase-like protein
MTTSATDPRPVTTPSTVPAWAHAAGMLLLGQAQVPKDATALADRALFTECIARYCWSYDERRLDALAKCFTDDAVWAGNVLGRIPIGPFEGRARIIKWLSEFWPHQRDQRRHMLLNTIVEEQTPDSALTLSYLLLLGSNGSIVALETSGFYQVKYRRTFDGWQIAHLLAGFDAPFWPGDINKMSAAGRLRHGVAVKDAE